MMDYRRRLYEHYVSTIFASIREISIDECENHRKFFRAYFRRLLPQDKRAKILDIGCGYGMFLYFLQKEGYDDALGVDISPEQVEAARRLGIGNVYCEDLLAFLKKCASNIDCITGLDVIEHFPKEEVLPFLDMAYQALKPGGTFILQSPNGDGPFGSSYRYCDFTHEVAFTKTSVSQILKATGFTDIRVYPQGPVVHGILSAGRWAIWQMIRPFLQLYLVAETGVFGGHLLTQNLIAVARKP